MLIVNNLFSLGLHTLLVVISFVAFLVFFLESFEIRGAHVNSCVETLDDEDTLAIDGSHLLNVSVFFLTLVTAMTVTRFFKYCQHITPAGGWKEVRWGALLDFKPKWKATTNYSDKSAVPDETRTKVVKALLFVFHCVSIAFLGMTLHVVDEAGSNTMCHYKVAGDRPFNPSMNIGLSVGTLAAAIFIEVVTLGVTTFTRTLIHSIQYQAININTESRDKAAVGNWVAWSNARYPLLTVTAGAAYILFWSAVTAYCSHTTIMLLVFTLLLLLFTLGLVTTNNTDSGKVLQTMAIGSGISGIILIFMSYYEFMRGPAVNTCYEDSDWIKWSFWVCAISFIGWVFVEVVLFVKRKQLNPKKRNESEGLVGGLDQYAALAKPKDKSELTFV